MSQLLYEMPPPPLMRELREVARDADALSDALRNANRLPQVFPKEPLLALLAGLIALVDGTAQGCHQPLAYARSRLPSIRRVFIQPEADPGTQPGEDQAPLTRGMTIDQLLGRVINSVTTALDEYRALASVEEIDPPDTAPSVTIDTKSPETARAIAAARLAEENLGRGIDALREAAKPGTPGTDRLQRQMRDARGLLSIARVELRMPEFVPRWFRETVDALLDYPRLLHATAEVALKGADLARAVADGWHVMRKRPIDAIIVGVKTAAMRLKAVADTWDMEQRLRAEGAVGRAKAASPDAPFDIGTLIEMIVGGEAPPASWRPHVTYLSLRDRSDVHTLTSLSGLTALKALDLSGTRVSDVAPLCGLTALQNLDLARARVSDVVPLASLTALQSLDLSITRVSDVAPLASLSALQSLDLSEAKVSDVTPLAKLTDLDSLDLSYTHVCNVAPLATMTALQSLDLSNTQVSDVAPLAKLTDLKSLDLSYNHVCNVAPLATMTALRSLDLSDTQVSDVAPLAKLTALHSLNLSYTQVSDVAPLAKLTALQSLDLSNTQVSDVAPLATLTAMQSLDLSDTQVNDVAPCAKLTALHSLNLSRTQVSDVAPLATLTALQSLYLSDTQVSDVAPLATLTALHSLDLCNTQVSDVAPLAALTSLRMLDLRKAPVRDVSALSRLKIGIFGLAKGEGTVDERKRRPKPPNAAQGLRIRSD